MYFIRSIYQSIRNIMTKWTKEFKREYQKNYMKEYRQTDKYKECIKEYYNKFKGYYLYLIKNNMGEVVYTGATTNYKTRFTNHCCGNVKTTKDFIGKGNYQIEYVDITDICECEVDMYLLENELIEMYQTELNATNLDSTYRLTNTDTVDVDHKDYLLSYVDDIIQDMRIYCTKKDTKKECL